MKSTTNSTLKTITTALPLAALLFATGGCNSESSSSSSDSGTPSSAGLKIEVIAAADTTPTGSTDASKRSVVISSQNQFQQELANYSGEQAENIDFSTNRVVLIDAGSKSTGGHSIDIVSAFRDEPAVVLEVDFTGPGEGCATTDAFTQPYAFVKINSTQEIMLSEQMRRDEPCDSE